MANIHENGINGNFSEAELINRALKAKQGEVNFTDYMKESLEKVALSEGFKNYKLNVDHGSAIGDGFVGLIYKATIVENDSDKKLHVVLKFPPFNKARRNDFGAMELFKREVFVYNEMLPEFVKFQKENNVDEREGFFNFPKCYFAECDEEKDDSILIMEDLRENSHRMWNKYHPVDLEHTKLLVATLGKFHAVSFALKVQKPEIFDRFKAMKDYLFEKMIGENADLTFSSMMTGSIERAAGTMDEKDIKGRNKVMRLKNDLAKIMKGLTSGELAEPYAVMGHGDCWSNNFMYQYNGKKPRKAVLLDWQIARYCSPVLDLVHFIFSCTDEVRTKHYDELLNTYHQSLKDLLDRLGGDTMTQFPFTALLRQLKQFGKFGIVMASIIIPASSTKNEDLPDMDKFAEGLGKDPKAMEEWSKMLNLGNDRVINRMRAAVLDTIRFGYL